MWGRMANPAQAGETSARDHALTRVGPPPLQGRPSRTERLLTDRSRWGSLTGSGLTQVLEDAKVGRLEDYAGWCEFMLEDIDIAADVESRVDRVLELPYVIKPPVGADRPIDQLAADLMSERFRDMQDLRASMKRLLHAFFCGVIPEAIDWQWDSEAQLLVPMRLVQRHLRRFRWDDVWELRLYDRGNKSKHDPDGKLLIPGGWVVHVVPTGIGYPGSYGVARRVSWPFLFSRWVDKFWIGDRDKNGKATWIQKVPDGATEEVREAALAALESAVASGVLVIEQSHEISAVVDAVNSKAGDGFQIYLDRQRKRIARMITGSDDMATAGDKGSQAAVETRAEMSVDPKTVADGNALMETFRRDLFTWFVRYNDWATLAKIHGVPWDGRAPKVPMGEFGGQAQAAAKSDAGAVPGVEAATQDDGSGDGVAEVATDNVQQAALNGAQVESMLEIVASVARGELPRASGVEMMIAAFPVDRQKAESIMGEVGKGFVPSTPDQQQPQQQPAPSPDTGTPAPLARALRRLR